MNASTPLQIDGKSYDRYSMTLAVSGRYTAPDQPDASVVLTLTPIRFEGEDCIAAQDHGHTILFGTLASADDAERLAVSEVQAALQKFIHSKGL
jgi:hypothetical protein